MELTKIAIGDDQIMLGSSVISDQWEVSFCCVVENWLVGWRLRMPSGSLPLLSSCKWHRCSQKHVWDQITCLSVFMWCYITSWWVTLIMTFGQWWDMSPKTTTLLAMTTNKIVLKKLQHTKICMTYFLQEKMSFHEISSQMFWYFVNVLFLVMNFCHNDNDHPNMS